MRSAISVVVRLFTFFRMRLVEYSEEKELLTRLYIFSLGAIFLNDYLCHESGFAMLRCRLSSIYLFFPDVI